VKTQAVADMKAQGIEYNQRMESWRRSNTEAEPDFIYSRSTHFPTAPVGRAGNIRQNPSAREMFEEFRSFWIT